MKKLVLVPTLAAALLLSGCSDHVAIDRISPNIFSVCQYRSGFLYTETCESGTPDPKVLDRTCWTIGRSIARIKELNDTTVLVVCGPFLYGKPRASGPHGRAQYLSPWQ